MIISKVIQFQTEQGSRVSPAGIKGNVGRKIFSLLFSELTRLDAEEADPRARADFDGSATSRPQGVTAAALVNN